MINEEPLDGPPRLFILVFVRPLVAAGSRDTSVPVGIESVLLDTLLVLLPPLLHVVVLLQMRNDNNDGNLAVAKHLRKKIICLLDRAGNPSAFHAKHDQTDAAGPLEFGNERARLVDGIQVVFCLHVSYSLVQTNCVMEGKLDPAEGDDVLL